MGPNYRQSEPLPCSRYSIYGLSGGVAIAMAMLLTQAGCGLEGERGATVTKPAAVAGGAAQSAFTAGVRAMPTKLSFNEHVQPILAENCYACHGADPGSRKAELRLDRAEYAFAPRKEGGKIMLPGDPDHSSLVQRIESKDPKHMMPPPEAHKTLKPEHAALLRRWVAEGAEYQEHWSFIAPQRPLPPAVSAARAGWPRNAIDRFVLARLEREGLAPSAKADGRSLLRRVSLDLTGLPPTPEEADAFVADAAFDAYERAVDRLLASPRFGEHRARYWLDYVRYADTHGIHYDNYRAIWLYRDYVIRALNANKPFDQFVREQLAGDLLPAKTMEELAATGFMRCNPTTNEGGTVVEEIFVNQTRDRVEAFGVTFLGLTTGCAACHDHKFDPVTQKDFYGLAAFLNNTAEKPWDLNSAEHKPVLRMPKDLNRSAAKVVFGLRADLKKKLEERRARALELTGAWLAAGNRPKAVASDCLELRLRLDEGKGDTVKNSAPGALGQTFKAETNPLIWGEKSWLWPSMRMDINSRLRLGSVGDVEADEEFSAGGWLMLRAITGGGHTGSGALLARMGDAKRRGGAGWELFQEGQQFTVNLVSGTDEPPAPEGAANPAALKSSGEKRGITVVTRNKFPRDEWLHVFVTVDGSRKAGGVKIYVNGKPVDVDVKLNSLDPKDSIRTDATMHLGRRDDFMPMRETCFQDVRFYRRMLSAEEVERLPFEDLAGEIVRRESDPAKWTTDEAFIVANQFFLGETDKETMELAASVAAHDAAFEALTKEGSASLIAVEKPTPAYADTLKRGDYYARLERVGPSTPHFLPPLPKGAPANRRGLAEWLLAPEQPLLGRVVVNRAWQEIFGRGLVETAGDFGIMGARPSHPELLDWLAVEFRESGWDVKKLYRLLVTSATYRQSAVVTPNLLARDPANLLFARGPRFRMDAEMLRDSALAASGLLVEKVGGPSVKPYQPAGIWEEVAMPESNTRTYVPDKGEGLYRRSLYTFWKRTSAPPSMETFDATSREVVCTRRARTNTPLQAFVTMNDPQWVEAARKLAERAMQGGADDAARISLIARLTVGRSLTPDENIIVAKSLAKYRGLFTTANDELMALLAVGEAPVDEKLDPVEVARWTLVASGFLNLDEFLTK